MIHVPQMEVDYAKLKKQREQRRLRQHFASQEKLRDGIAHAIQQERARRFFKYVCNELLFSIAGSASRSCLRGNDDKEIIHRLDSVAGVGCLLLPFVLICSRKNILEMRISDDSEVSVLEIHVNKSYWLSLETYQRLCGIIRTTIDVFRQDLDMYRIDLISYAPNSVGSAP